jgi:hypothetical protein
MARAGTLATLVALGATLSIKASAATFTVTTESDSSPGSLRRAIPDANATTRPDPLHNLP